jgi:hypothetical protein
LGLNKAPTITPKEGGWALVQYAKREKPSSTNVSIVVATWTEWARSIHVFALANGPDPVLNQDELVYRDSNGTMERRVIANFTELDN